MNITDIRIRKIDGGGKLRAYVTIAFDDAFVVHNIRIIDGDSGPFIAMPSRKTQSGNYKDVAHPISTDFRNLLQSKIFEEYEKMGDSMDNGQPLEENRDIDNK